MRDIGLGVAQNFLAVQRHFGDELVDRPAHGVREVIDGALTEPFDAYVRREFGPLIRKASAEG
ncbi:hypothetical protein ACFW6R_28285 [Streptomyces albidoflavus]